MIRLFERLMVWTMAACFVGGIVLAGCPSGSAVCTQLETRCANDWAQICNADGQWDSIADCSVVEGAGPFTCQVDEDGDHVCLPGEAP